MPYGFPSGEELVEKILTICSPTDERRPFLNAVLRCSQIEPRQLEPFAQDLRDSSYYSIDAFLQSRPEHTIVGKLLIATVLIPYEKPDIVRGDWYQVMFNQLRQNEMQGSNERLSILTFNYDRSLEYFLRRSYMAAFGFSKAEADRRAGKIEIIHMNGSLGQLWFADRPKGIGRRFQSEVEATEVCQAAKSIRMVHEECAQQIVAAAQRVLERATRVAFMGFSYHYENMKRLNLDDLFPGCRSFYGTIYRMGGAQVHQVRKLVPKPFEPFDLTCMDFLRDVPLLSS